MVRRLVVRGCGCLALALAILVFGGGAGYLLRKPLGVMAASCLVRSEAPVKADAAVVLGGDGTGDRTIKAAELAQAGWVPIVLLSGPRELVRYESSDMLTYAEEHGYPESLFQEIHHDSTSTKAEVAVLAAELRRRGIHRILLVTSLYHTRRAYALFHRAAPDIEIHVIAAPDPDFTPTTWFQSRQGWKIFVSEWTKTIAAWIGF